MLAANIQKQDMAKLRVVVFVSLPALTSLDVLNAKAFVSSVA
tara:strand:- start:4626 stop:4751 length:126 start_codon:yes stop_codon:yes gene_type:complete